MHATRLAIAAMREANWGRVINIASAHGPAASAQKSAYVAARHGIVGLTKAVAPEQIDDRATREGITVAKARTDLPGEKQPSLQFTTAEQLGRRAVFPCPPTADQVRGATWGGWTAQ